MPIDTPTMVKSAVSGLFDDTGFGVCAASEVYV